ncbi:MAG TPA: FAD/NAD(P)-binding oxidoreductase [Candidatus Limnocylindrales bacterium]|jgi:sulfide:quinone oxidoreductase|nr:FAD/NAD(P)-binding oxidoreductase [Candidatus Limnocylindrales bacterium]
MTMQRVLILGGGVGGTIVANLLARRLRRQIDAGDVDITLIDRLGEHVYQPGFMYIAMGGERAERLSRPERSLLDERVQLIVGEVVEIKEHERSVRLADGHWRGYEQLVIATGSRIVPEEVPHFEQQAHHFYTAEAAKRLRQALDGFSGGRIVIGIMGMPYKCPPAPLEVAFLIEAELRQRGLREQSEIHFCSPISRAFTIESVSDMATPVLAEKGIELHTFFNVEAIDPERRVVQSLEGEELPYDLLILVPPHRGAQVLIDSGLAPAPGGWLPTDRHTLRVGGRADIHALGDATDLPLSKAGSTAHFEAPVVVERVVAAIEGREPAGKHAEYEGRVMCFFEIGDGKGTLLRFDYDNPPRPPKPNRIWHLGKIVFNKTYWHTVPRGRV